MAVSNEGHFSKITGVLIEDKPLRQEIIDSTSSENSDFHAALNGGISAILYPLNIHLI